MMTYLAQLAVAVISASPGINNVFGAIALACNIAAIWGAQKFVSSKVLLVLGCATAILLPIIVTAYKEIVANPAGGISDPFASPFLVSLFAPTNFILMGIILGARKIQRIRRWAVVAFPCIIWSWAVIALISLTAGAQFDG